MSCNCTKIKDLPTCINELILGVVTVVDSEVNVYIRNNSVSQTIKLTGATDEDGLVTVDLSGLPDNYFSENYTYDIWVTETTAQPSQMLEQTLTGYDTYDCFMVKFFFVQSESLESVYYQTVQIELND